MIKTLHDMGVKSEYAYAAGVASIGLTYATYLTSRARNKDDKSQADRLGIFVATWAPTLFTLGTALRLEEGKKRRKSRSKVLSSRRRRLTRG